MKLKEEGRTRAIGVANFNTALLKTVVEDIKAPIACNQVEYHVMLDQTKVLAYLNAKSIPLVAYCPLAQGRVASDAVLAEIGAKHNASCRPGRAEMAARPGRRRRDPEGLAPREPAGQSRRAEDHARRRGPQARSPRCRRTGAASIPASRRRGTNLAERFEHAKKWPREGPFPYCVAH